MLENKDLKFRRYSKQQILMHRIIIISITSIVLLLLVILIAQRFTNKILSKPEDVQVQTEANNETNNTPKDTDIIPGSNICYGGEKYAVNAEDVQNIIKGQNIDNNKYIFLTFDDGPSPNTAKILDILKEKDAKATFFMLGTNIDKNDSLKPVIQRCISEGNAIGNHTYSHDPYRNNSVVTNIYIDEFNKTNNSLKSVLGPDFDSRITRMPGGRNTRVYYHDKNLPEFDETLKQNGIVSLDWTAMNGDADPHCKNFSVDQLLNEAEKESKGQNQIVILMHDTSGKDKTVQMLPALIDYYKTNGYEFKTIKTSYKPDNNQTSNN